MKTFHFTIDAHVQAQNIEQAFQIAMDCKRAVLEQPTWKIEANDIEVSTVEEM